MKFRILLLIAAVCAAQAAAAFSVEATAVGPDGEGVAYGTYRIFRPGGDKPLISNTTTLDGEIAQTLDAAGDYAITLSYVGLSDTTVNFSVGAAAPVARLGRIRMREASEALQGITVTAQKPLVVKQIDRIGYDVQADPTMATSTVRDILRKVPMVSVQADGTILVNGSSNFKIYRNGRPNNSLSRNAKDLFAALPASMIKRIEVITEPGAEYDAEGTAAILNIVTVENTVVKGVMGTASVDYDTGKDCPDPRVWLTTQVGKVVLSAYAGYSHLGGRQMKTRDRTTTTFADGSQRLSVGESKYKGDLTYFGLEGSYELDSLNLFTAEVSGYYYNIVPVYNPTLISDFDAAGTAVGGISARRSAATNNYFDVDASVNYQRSTRRRGETFTLSYLLSTTDQHSDERNDYSDAFGTLLQPYTAQTRDYRLRFIEHTFQADWVRPVGIHNINAGAKWIIRRNRSTDFQQYIGLPADSDSKFRHVTNIGAVYAQYGLRLGPVNLRAGLRYEYSHLKATYPDGSGAPFSADLNDLVPSAAASWQINDANSLGLTYAASISRPGISYLNPAVVTTPTSVSFGNADLESSRRQSVKLQYMLIGRKLNFNFSVDYAFVNNGIASVQYVGSGDGGGDIITSTYANIGRNRQVNFSAYAQWSPWAKTTFMLNGSLQWARNEQQGLSLCRWTPSLWLQATQQLPWKLSAEAMLWYGTGGLNGVYGYSTMRFHNAFHALSLSRNFLRDDRLGVRLSLNNPFGPRWRTNESRIVQGDYRQTSLDARDGGLSVRFTLSYRFGSLRAQVRKTAGSINNDDLVGRKK